MYKHYKDGFVILRRNENQKSKTQRSKFYKQGERYETLDRYSARR